MNRSNLVSARRFGIGTRTEVRLDDRRLLTLTVRAGELLRSGAGIVWATIDGELGDIVLAPGDVHVVGRDCELRVSAFDRASVEVYGHGPLQYRVPRRAPTQAAAAASCAALARRIRQLLAWRRPRAGPA